MSKAVKRPIFDPKKNYRWEPTDIFEFTLTGQQFAALYHLVSQEMNVTGGAPLSLKVEGHAVVMDLFRGAIEDGLIGEADSSEVTEAEERKVKKLFKTQ